MSCQIRNNANIDLTDLEQHIHGMYDHFHQKIGFQKPPVIVFDSDPSNESNVLGKTAYYDPQSFEVHVFTDARHPKDMLRSIAHELIHHGQNLEGRLDVGGYNGPGYYLKNDKLKDLEEEAMTNSAIYLREYEDGLKLKEKNEMSLKEWKNNELNGLLLKKFGILKEEKQINELTAAQKKLPKGLQDAIAKKEGDDTDSDEEDENLEEISGNANQASDRLQADEKSGREQGRLREEVLEEDDLEEGGLADREENSNNAAGRKEGGRYKRMKESIRKTIKENHKIRLKIKR